MRSLVLFIVCTLASGAYAANDTDPCGNRKIIEFLGLGKYADATRGARLDRMASFGGKSMAICQFTPVLSPQADACVRATANKYEDMIAIIPELKNPSFERAAKTIAQIPTRDMQSFKIYYRFNGETVAFDKARRTDVRQSETTDIAEINQDLGRLVTAIDRFCALGSLPDAAFERKFREFQGDWQVYFQE